MLIFVGASCESSRCLDRSKKQRDGLNRRDVRSCEVVSQLFTAQTAPMSPTSVPTRDWQHLTTGKDTSSGMSTVNHVRSRIEKASLVDLGQGC